MKTFSFGKTNAIVYIVDDDVTEFGIKTCVYIYTRMKRITIYASPILFQLIYIYIYIYI